MQENFTFLNQKITKLAEAVHFSKDNEDDYIYDAAFLRFKFVIESFWKLLKKILAYEEIDSNYPKRCNK
ncbi:MAG: hypothetical protein RCO49_03995 [Rickettsia endosymbiont of Argas persicus]